MGESVKIKVPHSGEGEIKLKLKLNGREVPEGAGLKLMDLNGNAVVNLRNVDAASSGQYTLEISNQSGSCSVPFNVIVKSPPGDCTGPLITSDTTPFSTKLAWKPPKDSGGGKITHYVVEKMEVGTGRWVPAAQSSGRDPHCEIQDPPGSPSDLEVGNIGEDFVLLNWQRPKSDGGGPLKGYYVEKREKGAQNWSRINQTPTMNTYLNIQHLIEDKAYDFRVIAINDAGESKPLQTDKPVIVRDPNAVKPVKISKNLRATQVREGADIELEVEVDCTSDFDVVWSKGGRELVPSHRYKMEKTKDGVCRLVIPDCGYDDADEYSVKIINRAGSKISRAPVTVKTAPQLRIPERWKEPTEWDRGDAIQIKIPFIGFPKPTCKLTMNGQPLSEGRGVSCKVTERHIIINLEDITDRFTGNLDLLVENELGSAGHSIKLQVNDRPKPPTDVKVDDVGDGSAILSWKMPPGTGYISQFIIERCEVPNGQWIRDGTSRFATYNCESVQNGKTYKFRVIAENLHGRSDPSSESSPALIEEKISAKKNRPDGSGRGHYDGGPITDYDRFCKLTWYLLRIFADHNLWKDSSPIPAYLKSGSVYDHYEILEELGSGAFGVVHRCRELATNKIFVAKFIKTPDTLSKMAVKNEIDIMNQLHHRRLLNLHDAFADRNETVLIMELSVS
ncbi:hypothetical protein Ciccas_008567 [Cichlidogyrus casuarinus]|uniref:Uncharacterized protein n=1 Tax=Cichlidogyrus casuarinus TaxID=1844966 RepID=A0ABD2PZZ0_9PLAT